MNKWRVTVSQFNHRSIDKYFHNKSEAIKFFNNYNNYNHYAAIGLLKYNGIIWIPKKIHFKYAES